MKFSNNAMVSFIALFAITLAGCEQQYSISSVPDGSAVKAETQNDTQPGAGNEPAAENSNNDPLPNDPSPNALPNPSPTASPDPSPTASPDVGNDPEESPVPAPSPSPSPYVIPDATPGVNAGCMPVQTVFLGFSGATASLSGGATIAGDAYLFKNTALSIGGSSRVTGAIFTDLASSTVSGGSASQVDLSLEAQVINYSNALAALEPTETLEAITSSKTIHGNGRLNVINIHGNIALNSSSVLYLDGSASDVFVINVQGDISIGGQASLQPAGGVLAKNIVFNSIGAGNPLSLNGGGVITGTFIGQNRTAGLSGTGVFRGSLFVRGLTASGGGQLWDPVIFCSSK